MNYNSNLNLNIFKFSTRGAFKNENSKNFSLFYHPNSATYRFGDFNGNSLTLTINDYQNDKSLDISFGTPWYQSLRLASINNSEVVDFIKSIHETELYNSHDGEENYLPDLKKDFLDYKNTIFSNSKILKDFDPYLVAMRAEWFDFLFNFYIELAKSNEQEVPAVLSKFKKKAAVLRSSGKTFETFPKTIYNVQLRNWNAANLAKWLKGNYEALNVEQSVLLSGVDILYSLPKDSSFIQQVREQLLKKIVYFFGLMNIKTVNCMI